MLHDCIQGRVPIVSIVQGKIPHYTCVMMTQLQTLDPILIILVDACVGLVGKGTSNANPQIHPKRQDQTVRTHFVIQHRLVFVRRRIRLFVFPRRKPIGALREFVQSHDENNPYYVYQWNTTDGYLKMYLSKLTRKF